MEISDTATSGLLGIAGVVVGAFLSRWLAKAGKIYGRATVVDSSAAGIVGTIVEKPSLPIDYAVFSAASNLEYRFDVYLFNERDTPTGLRDIHVRFYGNNIEEIERPVTQRVSEEGVDEDDPISIVNLPSGSYVHLKLKVALGLDLLHEKREAISQYNRAQFRGILPDGTVFSRIINFPTT